MRKLVFWTIVTLLVIHLFGKGDSFADKTAYMFSKLQDLVTVIADKVEDLADHPAFQQDDGGGR